MATLATFFRRPELMARAEEKTVERPVPRAKVNPYALRALPGEHVFFYSKRIDNSRIVRAADPNSGGDCWTVIGAGTAVAALITALLIPSLGGILAGYRIESLLA